MKCGAQLGSGWSSRSPQDGWIATRAVRNSNVPRTVTLRNLGESGRKSLGHGDCTVSPAGLRWLDLPVRGEAGSGAHDDQVGGGGSEARTDPRRTVGPAARHDPSIKNVNEAHALTEKVWESHSWVIDGPRFRSDWCRHRLSRGGVKPVRNPRAFRSAPWRL